MNVPHLTRSRWAALGAALAVSVGLVRVTEPGEAAPRSTPLGENDTHTVTAHGTNGNCTLPD